MLRSISDKFALRFVESQRFRKRLMLAFLILVAGTLLTVVSNPLKRGLIEQYYDNVEWAGSPILTTRDRLVALWRMKSEYPEITENYSIQWTGAIFIPLSGEYQFTTISDDGSELHIDGQIVVDNRGFHGFLEQTGAIQLEKGVHPIIVRYMQGGGAANFSAYWKQPGKKRELLSHALFFTKKPTKIAFVIGRVLETVLTVCTFFWLIWFLSVALVGFCSYQILLPLLKSSFIGRLLIRCRSRIVEENIEKYDVPAPPQKDVRASFLAVLGYTLLSLIWMYPLIGHFSTRMIGLGGDRYIYVWNMWWLKKALLDLHTNPLHTDYVFYPKGVSLAFHDFSLLNAFFSLPLQSIFTLSEIYNLLFLLTFILGGFGCFLLVRYLTGDHLAAFLSGLIFAFWGGRVYNVDHLSLASIQWFPFCALYLIKTLWEKSYRNPILAAIFLVMNALSAWYYAIYMTLFVALFLFYAAWAERKLFFRISSLKRFGLIGILFIVLMAPIVYPMMIQIFEGQDYMRAPVQPEESVSLNTLFLPSINHPVLGKHIRYFYARADLPVQWGIVGGSFVGYTVLFLCLYSGFRLRRVKQKFWLIAAMFFLLLSLGPHLRVFSKSYTWLPLPYLLLQHIPVLKILRIPVRFMVLVMLCCSVLAGYACWDLLRRIRIRKTIFSLLAVLILFEFVRFCYVKPLEKVPSFYKELGQDSEIYAILELTRLMKWEHSSVRASLFQITHGKKLFHGHVSRIPPEVYQQGYALYPIFSDLLTQPQEYMDQPVGTNLSLNDDKKSILPILFFYNVRYIALYHDYPYGNFEENLERLRRLLGKEVSTQYGIYFLKVPQIPLSESLIFPGLGMFPLQFDKNGDSVRQTAREADIKVLNVDHYQKVRLRFQGKSSVLPEEQVEIYINGTLITTAIVRDWTDVIMPAVAITPGENTIRLRTLDNGHWKYGIQMRNIEVELL